MKTMFAIAAAAATLLVVPAIAQDGDDYRFTLVNHSAVSAIEFVTMRKDGRWSGNWLRTPIKPADKRPLVFAGGDDRCEIRTRITFSDGSKFDTPVDYCGVTQVIATDETLYSQ
jgi:hypothetical protein